jgi:hypothetical protein
MQLIKPFKTQTKNAPNALPEDNDLTEDKLKCQVKLICQKINNLPEVKMN